jgi:hypothetical protein
MLSLELPGLQPDLEGSICPIKACSSFIKSQSSKKYLQSMRRILQPLLAHCATSVDDLDD